MYGFVGFDLKSKVEDRKALNCMRILTILENGSRTGNRTQLSSVKGKDPKTDRRYGR